MTAAERLAFHQAHSAQVMESLRLWIAEQFDERLVEPNSSLGKALAYMLKHWDGLTKFLTVGGAPLDNNVCEVRFVSQKLNLCSGDWLHMARNDLLAT